MKKRKKRYHNKKKRLLVQLVIPTRSLAQIPPAGNQSSVARLMAEITAQYEAAQWALSGQAVGIAKHQFITARMEHIEDARQELTQLVGDPDEATRLVVESLMKSEEGEVP